MNEGVTVTEGVTVSISVTPDGTPVTRGLIKQCHPTIPGNLICVHLLKLMTGHGDTCEML